MGANRHENQEARVTLVRGFAEESINPVERDGAAADDCTRGYRAPEDIGAGKFPDGEERREDGHEYAQAGYPEGDTSDHGWIQKPALLAGCLRVLHIFLCASAGQRRNAVEPAPMCCAMLRCQHSTSARHLQGLAVTHFAQW